VYKMLIKRIFSGIQPSGVPHIGNYVGAIKNWVDLQNNFKGERNNLLFCVVDLHALTVKQDSKVLRDNIYSMVASLLACGIDPKKSLVFQQSQVPYHSELTWYLSCNASTGQLKRMHQWKTKAGKEKDEANLGLFSYPVLMSADILLYKATHIPVGDDQTQHIELTRDLAESFNKQYGNIFPVPTTLLTTAPRIMSLRNPKNKMSKSDSNKNSCINITDSNDEIVFKLKKAVTDSAPYITHDLNNREGVCNLIDIYSAMTNKRPEDIIQHYTDLEYFTKTLKKDLTDVVINELAPIRSEYERIIKDQAYLHHILEEGSNTANELALETIKEIRQHLGLR